MMYIYPLFVTGLFIPAGSHQGDFRHPSYIIATDRHLSMSLPRARLSFYAVTIQPISTHNECMYGSEGGEWTQKLCFEHFHYWV